MELLIVIVVIGLLSTVFIPSYLQYTSRTRVKTAIRYILTMKKAVDSMANVCRGYPMRIDDPNMDSDPTDINTLLRVIDLTECRGDQSINEYNAYIFPKKNQCTGESISKEMLNAYPGSGASTLYHSSTLCKSSCELGDNACYATLGENNFWDVFVTDPAEPLCSPNYGAPAGPEFPGPYTPGWNYNLLYSGYPGDVTNAHNKPVAVICGVARGYKTGTVKIIVNTGGYYSGTAVADGSGVFDINGAPLASGCPCGPYCKDNLTGREGCCASCGHEKGIGFKF